MHAEDDRWPLKTPIKKVNAKNLVVGAVSTVKQAWTSIQVAFAAPASAQLAFA